MSTINKKSIYTKFSYTIGDINILTTSTGVFIFTCILLSLNFNLVIYLTPILIISFIVTIIGMICKSKDKTGRWIPEKIFTFINFYIKNKIQIDNTLVETINQKNYIKINHKFTFGFKLFPEDQKSNNIDTQDSNQYIFVNLIDKSKYQLQFKSIKKLFNNSLFDTLGLSFDSTNKFIQYDYYLYVTLNKEEDINFARKHILNNLLMNNQTLNEQELLELN